MWSLCVGGDKVKEKVTTEGERERKKERESLRRVGEGERGKE